MMSISASYDCSSHILKASETYDPLPLVRVLDLVKDLAEVVEQIPSSVDHFFREYVLFSVHPKVRESYEAMKGSKLTFLG